MLKLIEISTYAILIIIISANLCQSIDIKQKTTGKQSPAMYVSPGGSGTVNYDISEESISKLVQEISILRNEVNKNFLKCWETLIEYQDKKIEEINIKFAEYISAEKGVTDEKAKSWAKEIIEGTDDFREFEKDNERRKELLDEFNSQMSKGLVASSYAVAAYILDIFDTSIRDIKNLNLDEKQNIKYEDSDNLNLFRKSTDDNKPFIARSLIMAEGTLELWTTPGRFNDNGLVESCPVLTFKVVGGKSKIKELRIYGKEKSGGGSASVVTGNLGYKRLEIVYPYDHIPYYPWKPEVLDQQFKDKFAENYKSFMKFAMAVCRGN